MLRSTLTVLGMQRDEACARAGGANAYYAAIAGWWSFWARQLLEGIGRRWRESPFDSRLYHDVWTLVRFSVPVCVMRVRRKLARLLARAFPTA